MPPMPLLSQAGAERKLKPALHRSTSGSAVGPRYQALIVSQLRALLESNHYGGLRTSMRGVPSTGDIEMSIAAAIFATGYWLGLQVELILVCVHSRMLGFAGFFPGRYIGRSSTLRNKFHSADSTDIVHR
jgi:hypothetical protein